jgi:ribosomal protein S16
LPAAAPKRPFTTLPSPTAQCAQWRFIERVGFFNPVARQEERLRVDNERVAY